MVDVGDAVPTGTLNFKKLVLLDNNKINDGDLSILKKAIVERMGVESPDAILANTVMGLVMYALANVSTSDKAHPPADAVLVSAELEDGGKLISIKWSDLKKAIDSTPKLMNFKNPLRVLCRTFVEDYLKFCRENKGTLRPIARANKHGVPAEFHYLIADFVQTSDSLSEHEQAVLFMARKEATRSLETGQGAVYNLNMLGKRSGD